MTAVEWLFTQMSNVSAGFVTELNELEMLQKAKKMEKEQILKACNEWFTEGCRYATGFEQTVWQDEEDYYNQTFKSE